MTAKDTKGKAKLRLVPYDSLVAIAAVREFGVQKYGDDTGWLDVDTVDFQEAAMRHLGKVMSGEEFDCESGLPHVYHALTSLAMAVSVRNFKHKKKCVKPPSYETLVEAYKGQVEQQCEWDHQF